MAYDFEKWVANGRKSVKRTRWTPYLLGLIMVSMGAWGVSAIVSDDASTGGFPGSIFLILAFLVRSPFTRDACLGPRAEKVFDEFERDALLRATKHSYLAVLAILSLLFFWLGLATGNNWPVPVTSRDWISLGFAVIGVSVVMPIFFAEIMVPLPPVGDTPDE